MFAGREPYTPALPSLIQFASGQLQHFKGPFKTY